MNICLAISILSNLLKFILFTENPEEKEARVEAEREEEPDIPLEEADYDYYGKPGRDYSFLTDIADRLAIYLLSQLLITLFGFSAGFI